MAKQGRGAKRAANGKTQAASSGNGRAESSGSSNGALHKLELPLFQLPSAHPCNACGDCCRYVAIEIDDPTTNKEYENVAWYLSHRDVSVYVDWESEWYIEFRTVCENLTDSATCGIYEERPQICSDFSWEECERTSNESAARYRFETPPQFVEWLQARRPKSFERYLKFRKELLARRAQPGGGKRRAARGEGAPAR